MLTTNTLPEWLQGERSIHVFLSFLGHDTCQEFVDCLYHFMKDAGIRVFKDGEENPAGEKIEKILEAIKTSTICIPVFSKKYTSNKWCLLELAGMVELKKRIIPIFYDVSPDDVKPEPSLYAEALEALYAGRKRRKLNGEGESKLRKETMQWETALQEVGPFTGRELKNTGYGEFCKTIIREVSDALMTDEKRVMNHLLLMDHIMDMEDQFKKAVTDHPKRMDVEEPERVSISGPQEMSGRRPCQRPGCPEGAERRTAYCKGHGGGRRCESLGCTKSAEGPTEYCISHGGGRRCEFLGCTKSAEGPAEYCISHGGGQHCSHDGCTKAARGKSGLCITHGGGRRCREYGCGKSAEGLSGLCIPHGGGPRCQFPGGCTKGAQGSTQFCKAHGGGKRCTYPGCWKGVEGSTPFCKGHGGGKRCLFEGGGVCTKSVHGGTNFCVAHGGGKRCAMPDCTRSARGRTAFCVKHGGGRRCTALGCPRSAEGNTDFCQFHGGGKRCSWGHSGSQGGVPCTAFARGRTGLCDFHNSMAQDKPVVNQPDKTNESALTAEDGSVVLTSHESSFRWNSDDLIIALGFPSTSQFSDGSSTFQSAEGVSSVYPYLPEQLTAESSAQGRHFKPAENYEVFLSFHGPDNSQGFIHVLYHSLKDAGICVFKNDRDKIVGENIAEISEAIENSIICIPVFSRNYASSKWCLHEIAMMFERNKKIIPVLFDVTPDDVTLKTTLYVDALEALHVTKDGPEIRRWKEALREVGKITRLELGDTGYTKFCNSIGQAILNVLKIQETIVKDHLVGMDAPFVKVLHLLDIEVDDVRYVGIHGKGGVGKTTLARVIFNQLSPRFEYSSFLSDIGESSQRHGIVHLQRQLLDDLNISRDNNFNSDYGVKRIIEEYRYRKVLIVLDDVNQKEQIDKLAGKSSWFAPGSRIIVTSRNESVLVFEESTSEQSKRVFEMQGMENIGNALQLLSFHAFGTASPTAKYMDLSKRAVSAIGFLPLCLEIIGSLLRSKSEDYWEQTIKALDTIPREDIQQKLMLSCEALDYKTRQIFLDIACVLVGEALSNAIYMWEACKFDPKTGIEYLVSMSLVKVVGGKLQMHDYVRDLGRDIVNRENLKDTGKRSRLWRADDDVLAILKRGEVSEGVEALFVSHHEIRSGSSQKSPELTGKSFEKLSELRFLKLWSNGGINLVGDFEGLLQNLRWLSWRNCPGDLEAKNLNLVNLVVLDLSHSYSRWLSPIFPISDLRQIGNHLKVLDLSHCILLFKLPDLSEYPSLERLVLEGCWGLFRIGSSIGKLKALKHLNLIGCYGLGSLPEELYSLENLEELLLRRAHRLTTLSEGIGNLKSLVNLQLGDIQDLRRLPESIGRCKKLERLSLRGCRRITQLPDSLGDLVSLVELDISYTGITRLPESIGALTELNVLKIHGSKIRELPRSIKRLGKLQADS